MSQAPTEEKKTLVVLGATGSQGGAVLRYFAEHVNGFTLRGITRNPDSGASQRLHALGVEMVRADVGDTKSLKAAFAGATHIFATTDSNQIILNTVNHPEKLKENETPLTHAQAIEEQMGRNIIEAAAGTTTLERIVWSSLVSPKKWSKGKYRNVTMFDAKENIADKMAKNQSLKGKMSTVLIGFYVDNAIRLREFYAPEKQPDGVYELSLPMSGDHPIPVADLDSDLGSWVHALFQSPPGLKLIGSSEQLTWKQWIRLWAEQLGVQGKFRRTDFEEYSKRMEPFSGAVGEEFLFTEEFGFSGGLDVVWPEDIRKRGIEIKTSSVAEAIQKVDWSSVL